MPIPGEQRPGIHAGLKYALVRIREKSFSNSKNIKTAENCGMGAKDKCFMVSFFRNHDFSEYAFPLVDVSVFQVFMDSGSLIFFC